MKRIRKLQILMFALILIFNCIFIGFAMAHNLYFKESDSGQFKNQTLGYFNLYPQSNIYLDDVLSYTTNNNYTMFKNPVTIPSAAVVWYKYNDETVRDRFIYTADRFKTEKCGYDQSSELLNGYLFKNITNWDINSVEYKNVDTLNSFASATAKCKITLTATTPLGSGSFSYTDFTYNVGDEPLFSIPRDLFVFDGVDNTAAREYLCDSYTVKIKQGTTLIIYPRDTKPSSDEITTFVRNIVGGTDSLKSVVVQTNESGHPQYIWYPDPAYTNGGRWIGRGSELGAEPSDGGNLLAVELIQTGTPKKNGSEVRLDVFDLQVTQSLLDLTADSPSIQTKTIQNVPDPQFTGTSVEFESTPVINGINSTVFTGIITTIGARKYLLDGIYLDTSGINTATGSVILVGTRKVYYNGNILTWDYICTMASKISTSNNISVRNVKWESRDLDMGSQFSVDVIVVYLPGVATSQLTEPRNVRATWELYPDQSGNWDVSLKVTNANPINVTAHWDSETLRKSGSIEIPANTNDYTIGLSVEPDKQSEGALDGSIYFTADGYINSKSVTFD